MPLEGAGSSCRRNRPRQAKELLIAMKYFSDSEKEMSTTLRYGGGAECVGNSRGPRSGKVDPETEKIIFWK